MIKAFSELTNTELYALLKLRSEVFVVEQRCVYLDIDDLDQQAWHLLSFAEDSLAGYCRIYVDKDQSVIGRVVVDKAHRGQKLARQLMHAALEFIQTTDGLPKQVYVMAQLYLQAFYQSLGFNPVTEPFDEDGILHVRMVFK